MSMTVTKHDLILRISEKTGLQQQEAQMMLETVLESISSSLSEGNKVELRNFGVFDIKVRNARVGRNPRSPAKTVAIPERAVVKFRAGKQLRSDVLELYGKLKPPQQPSQP